MNLKVAQAYWEAEIDNICLQSDNSFGKRKYIHVGMQRQISSNGKKNGSKKNKWPHSSDTILRSRVAYNVKFLGHTVVDEAKGVEVVKGAIRKMKFNKQLKKSEGLKPQKVELSISVDGVIVQDPKYKVIQHQFPLHKISYCADDKSDKRVVTFIAHIPEQQKHECFVFDSDKCAEEITLTIGQAFELAYQKFIEKNNHSVDIRKQLLLHQKKVQQLTQENLHLKARVADLERIINPSVLEEFDRRKPNESNETVTMAEPSVGRKLEGLVFETETPISMKLNMLCFRDHTTFFIIS
ncbi:DgyrCDS13930 [Dimorphilus gyrociliatus]|uniref:DgyrCDS13930 n=1 Tax=Dimorphilus gyrociliatus TaxID=2664684 RepID=A0A7I8WC30_9ANNE|nr:DgyrCDS13930 [Dimorphilus gyrociliatus]